MQNNISVIQTGVLSVNTIIVPLINNKCFVVDPAACKLSKDSTKIIDFLKENNMECIAVILTHSHFDHIMGILEIQKAFPNIKIAIHKEEFLQMQNADSTENRQTTSFFGNPQIMDILLEQPKPNYSLNHNQTLDCLFTDAELNSTLKQELLNWKVLHTPGHSSGSICIYNKNQNILISGDTIFDFGGYGRTDLPGGDEEKIMQTLQTLYQTLPANTKVYPGHDSFGFTLV